jgi:hypothetical protein
VIAAEALAPTSLQTFEAVATQPTAADRLAEAASAALVAVPAEPLRATARPSLTRVHLAELKIEPTSSQSQLLASIGTG